MKEQKTEMAKQNSLQRWLKWVNRAADNINPHNELSAFADHFVEEAQELAHALKASGCGTHALPNREQVQADAYDVLNMFAVLWTACGLDFNFEELVEEFDKRAEKTGEAKA